MAALLTSTPPVGRDGREEGGRTGEADLSRHLSIKGFLGKIKKTESLLPIIYFFASGLSKITKQHKQMCRRFLRACIRDRSKGESHVTCPLDCGRAPVMQKSRRGLPKINYNLILMDINSTKDTEDSTRHIRPQGDVSI